MTDFIHIEPAHQHRQGFARWCLAQTPRIETASATGSDVPLDLYSSVPPELLEGAYVDGFRYDLVQPQPVAPELAAPEPVAEQLPAEEPVELIASATGNDAMALLDEDPVIQAALAALENGATQEEALDAARAVETDTSKRLVITTPERSPRRNRKAAQS